jgi:hypothetical protein
MHEPLGSIPSTVKKRERERERERKKMKIINQKIDRTVCSIYTSEVTA